MYFITTVTYDRLHWDDGYRGDSRCVGFYHYFSDADDAVLSNMYDIHEGDYDYVVIEEIRGEGLYPGIDSSRWYQWDYDHDQYQPIERPVEAKYLTNFCLG